MSQETTLPAQRRKLGRGMTFSLIGLLLSWIPGLGALLCLLGLFQIISAYTPANRALYTIYLIISTLLTLLTISLLATMLYIYFARPDILAQVQSWIIQFLSR